MLYFSATIDRVCVVASMLKQQRLWERLPLPAPPRTAQTAPPAPRFDQVTLTKYFHLSLYSDAHCFHPRLLYVGADRDLRIGGGVETGDDREAWSGRS